MRSRSIGSSIPLATATRNSDVSCSYVGIMPAAKLPVGGAALDTASSARRCCLRAASPERTSAVRRGSRESGEGAPWRSSISQRSLPPRSACRRAVLHRHC